MKTFVFSVKSSKVEDFEIIIEVLANQTFEDLFNTLKQTIGFQDNELASFYLCNSVWKPQKEIVLIDMGQEDNDNDIALLMSKTKINIIEDPHQKILFVYDYIKNHEFQMELIKIKDSEPNIKYPHIAKITGKYLETFMPPTPSTFLLNDQIVDDESADESEDDVDDEMIEVIEKPTDDIDSDEEDLITPDKDTAEHFFEDIADMDLNDDEEQEDLDDDLLK
jgi:hypothetical protein